MEMKPFSSVSRQEVILYFGSFNPVHNGHIALARTVSEQVPHAEIWFVLSAQNPFKQQNDLWPEELRTNLLKKAIDPIPAFRFCDAELKLPKPSYTIRTLHFLTELHPHTDFSILIGEDNLPAFPHWKDYRDILEICRLLVYPRLREDAMPKEKYEILEQYPQRIRFLENLPLLNISSTEIRKKIARGENIADAVPWESTLLPANFLKKTEP